MTILRRLGSGILLYEAGHVEILMPGQNAPDLDGISDDKPSEPDTVLRKLNCRFQIKDDQDISVRKTVGRMTEVFV
jgi:hypothetical protein